ISNEGSCFQHFARLCLVSQISEHVLYRCQLFSLRHPFSVRRFVRSNELLQLLHSPCHTRSLSNLRQRCLTCGYVNFSLRPWHKFHCSLYTWSSRYVLKVLLCCIQFLMSQRVIKLVLISYLC